MFHIRLAIFEQLNCLILFFAFGRQQHCFSIDEPYHWFVDCCFQTAQQSGSKGFLLFQALGRRENCQAVLNQQQLLVSLCFQNFLGVADQKQVFAMFYGTGVIRNRYPIKVPELKSGTGSHLQNKNCKWRNTSEPHDHYGLQVQNAFQIRSTLAC